MVCMSKFILANLETCMDVHIKMKNVNTQYSNVGCAIDTEITTGDTRYRMLPY